MTGDPNVGYVLKCAVVTAVLLAVIFFIRIKYGAILS
jgi:hypothetical protein